LNVHLASDSTRIRNDGQEVHVGGNGHEVVCHRILYAASGGIALKSRV